MKNYRQCLERINSKEHYKEFEESGFFTYVRDGNSTIQDAVDKIERHFGLVK